MEHETGTIKGKKTSYTKSDGSKVVKYSKTINLGVNSAFDCGTNVVVMVETDYKQLTSSTDAETLNSIIAENETTIKELSSKVAGLSRELKEVTSNNNSNVVKIADLTAELKGAELELTEIKTILKQYNINGADDLNTLIIEFRAIINYFADCLKAYQHQSRVNGFLKRNPTTDIGKPATKLIDYRGNKYADTSNEYEANKVNDLTK